MSARPDRRSQDLTPQPSYPHRAAPLLRNPRPPSERCAVLRAKLYPLNPPYCPERSAPVLKAAHRSSHQSTSLFSELSPFSLKPPHCPQSYFPDPRAAPMSSAPFLKAAPLSSELFASPSAAPCSQSSAPFLKAAPLSSEPPHRSQSFFPPSQQLAVFRTGRYAEGLTRSRACRPMNSNLSVRSAEVIEH